MEPLAAGQVGDGSIAGVGVIVVMLAGCVMATGALITCLVDCGVVTDVLMACMMVTGASLSQGENQVLADAAAGGKFKDISSLPGRRG